MYSKSVCLLFASLAVLAPVEAAPALRVRHDAHDYDSTASATTVTTNSVPSSTPVFNVTQNALDAQKMNAKFSSLSGKESCEPFTPVCINGNWAICTADKKYDLRPCYDTNDICAATPLTNRNGTVVVCDTKENVIQRFKDAGVTDTGPIYGIINSTDIDASTGESERCDDDDDDANTESDSDCDSESLTLSSIPMPRTVRSATPTISATPQATTVFVTVTASPLNSSPVLQRRQLLSVSDSLSTAFTFPSFPTSSASPSSSSLPTVIPLSSVSTTAIFSSSAPTVLSTPTLSTATVSSIPVITPTVVIGTDGIVTVTIVSTSVVTVLATECSAVTSSLPTLVSVTPSATLLSTVTPTAENTILNSGVSSPPTITITHPLTFGSATPSTSTAISVSAITFLSSSVSSVPSATSSASNNGSGGGFGDFSSSFSFGQPTAS